MHGLDEIIHMNNRAATQAAPDRGNLYRVWNVLDTTRPEDGDLVRAVSSFDARRRYAFKHHCGYQDCAARRIDE